MDARTRNLSGHEKRKLRIFKKMNLAFGLTPGILFPTAAWLLGIRLSAPAWFFAAAGPLLVCILSAILIRLGQFERARLFFFILHPLLLTGVYLLRIDPGTDLFFICYGVLSVFFLQNLYHVIFSFSLSLTCYFMAHGHGRAALVSLETSNIDLYLFNRLLAIFFIFYGIFLIRNENDRYQLQLNELNSLKSKLFSVIAHDLRGPLHAMVHLFKHMVQYDLPADEIKELIPEVARGLGETTGQIENLLEWAKSQMQSEVIRPQLLEISQVIHDVLSFLHLQVEAKELRIEKRLSQPVYVYADKEMMRLVLRNLLSNAIKFTPERGVITVGASESPTDIEVYVRDTGTGISPENLERLAQNVQYSTPGTANESGTGLGLLLCREFLSRNGGYLEVASQLGKGSTFSFSLPKQI